MTLPETSHTAEQAAAGAETTALDEQVLAKGWELLGEVLQNPREFILNHNGKRFQYKDDESGLDFTSWAAYAAGHDKAGKPSLMTMTVDKILVHNAGDTEAKSGVRIVVANGKNEAIGFTQPENSADGDGYLTVSQNTNPSSKADLSGEPTSVDIFPEDPTYKQELLHLLSLLGGNIKWYGVEPEPENPDETIRQETEREAKEAAAVSSNEHSDRHPRPVPALGRIALVS